VQLADTSPPKSVTQGIHPLAITTHYAYPQPDGQAEFTWVAGYIPTYQDGLPALRQSPIQVPARPDNT